MGPRLFGDDKEILNSIAAYVIPAKSLHQRSDGGNLLNIYKRWPLRLLDECLLSKFFLLQYFDILFEK